MFIEPSKLVQEIEEDSEDTISESYERNKKFWETQHSNEELIKHMEGRTWAELDAAIFMAKALASTARDLTLRGDFDILESLAKQIWDECRHARYCANMIKSLGGNLDRYRPIPGLQKAYDYAFDVAEKGDLLSLHSGNMLVGEAQTLGSFRGIKAACEATGRYPELLRVCNIVERDEIFHVNNGRRVIKRFATTGDLQEKARQAAKFYKEAKLLSIRRT